MVKASPSPYLLEILLEVHALDVYRHLHQLQLEHGGDRVLAGLDLPLRVTAGALELLVEVQQQKIALVPSLCKNASYIYT